MSGANCSKGGEGLAGCNTVARFCKQCMCSNDYGCESAAVVLCEIN